MTTINRERIEQALENPTKIILNYGDTLELARIALASLTANPVAWTDKQELRDVDESGIGYLFTVNPITPHADPRRVIKLYTAAPAPEVPHTFPESVWDVLKERHRQITVKGYSPEQDDTYIEGELAAAAISYIEPMEAENYWPADWLDDSFKPSDYRRNLVKACALLFAEIERYDRQEATGG